MDCDLQQEEAWSPSLITVTYTLSTPVSEVDPVQLNVLL
jgi:hypothetical protein